MKIIMLGPQASGKGTQASMLSDETGIPHISTGDALRKNIREMTELGRIAQDYMNKGQLVPDNLVNKIIAGRLKERDCENGFILDGYPRNVAQAEFLDTVTEIEHVIEINVSDKEAIKRISGRRTCDKCGAIYSIYQSNEEALSGACKKCGGRLVSRDDDKEEAVRKRLEIYHTETAPIAIHYKKVLMKINGERPIEKIYEEIKKKLKV